MNLEAFAVLYSIIGLLIFLMVMMRAYNQVNAVELIFCLLLCFGLWPVILIVALLRMTVFRHYDQD